MLTNFGSSIDKYLTQKTVEDDRDYSYLHPSDFGGCLVQTWLKSTGVKPLVPFNSTKIRIFDNGHYVHLRNQIYAKEIGLLAKDQIIKKYKPEDITIGFEPKTKIRIDGSSGRSYYYSPGEIIWRVEKNNDIDIKIGTDNAPYWETIDNLKEGDEWWMVEIPLVDTEHHFGGHCDAIILNDGVETVIDYKGISDYSWTYVFRDEKKTYLTQYPDSYNSSCFICGKNMKKAKDLCEHLNKEHMDELFLDKKYNVQLHIYMMILGLDQALLWYENKNNQVVIDHLVKKDEVLVEKIKDNATKLWNKISSKEMPKRQSNYVRTKLPCSYCDYASQCWNK